MSTSIIRGSSSLLPDPVCSRRTTINTMSARAEHSRTEPHSFHPKNRSQNDYIRNKYAKLSRPSFCDLVSRYPIGGTDEFWLKIQAEARSDVDQEPILASYYYATVLSHCSLERALANHLGTKLSYTNLPSNVLFEIFHGVLSEDRDIQRAIRDDLKAVKERDPACISFVHCLLNFKGFLACQAYRVAHKLWSQGRIILALLIQNRVSEVFGVDIHPGANIGWGILLDHATGIVIGETATVGNNVSILHNVTLGGSGKVSGDRHPKVGNGVLIGAGTQVLGNIRIGEGAKIGAGSVVLKEVPPRTTAVGNPARLIGGKENSTKLKKIPSFTMDHISFVSTDDYMI